MSKTLTPSLSQRKVTSTKLVMGLAVAAVSVLVGTSNIANAMPGRPSGHGHGSSAAHGHASAAGFGYGGGSVNVGVGNITGDNNVIVIIVNYFVGH